MCGAGLGAIGGRGLERWEATSKQRIAARRITGEQRLWRKTTDGLNTKTVERPEKLL